MNMMKDGPIKDAIYAIDAAARAKEEVIKAIIELRKTEKDLSETIKTSLNNYNQYVINQVFSRSLEPETIEVEGKLERWIRDQLNNIQRGE